MNVLIVDDEDTARYGMRKAIKGQARILDASNLTAARKVLDREPVDLVLLDLNLGGENGFDLLNDINHLEPRPKVVIITAHGNEKIAVQAIKSGAFDYVAKPFDIDELRLVVRNAHDQVELLRENQRLRTELAAAGGFGDMIGSSPAMERVYSLIDRVAETDATVLLTGESGSGKEMVAREVHKRSLRHAGSMVSVNCAAIPESLIESELFGHEKGAFTGATARRSGKFEKAEAGTLFLDEIGDMPLDTQVKILRAIESGEIERLGGAEPIQTDVRLISATHRDLKQRVADGTFREDLFYRLEVVEIPIPPLRQRREDVPALVSHFIAVFAGRHGRPVHGITPEAMNRMVAFPFPGNVRQLRNMVEKMVVLNQAEQIDETDLPREVRFFLPQDEISLSSESLEPFFALDFKAARENFEIKYLLWNLRTNENNITRTAEAIGIHRQSLQQKIRDLNLREWMDVN